MFLDQNSVSREKFSRIISLVPSQTELLHYLGLDEEVIGITKFCVHPKEWFRQKQRIGGTKMLNMEKIAALKPDLIIANKEENEKGQVEALARDYNVWVTDVNKLEDAVEMIHDVGSLTGREEKAHALGREIMQKFELLKQVIRTKSTTKVAYFIWQKPYMVAGGDTFINSMLNYCGFENIFAHAERYPEISLDKIKELECELILLSSEPYPFNEKHKNQVEKEFPNLQVKLVDGEMFSWYGSRLLQSADYFKSIIAVP